MLAPEYGKEQNNYGYLQRIRDEEGYLRTQEQDPPNSIDVSLPIQQNNHAKGQPHNCHTFEHLSLIMHADIVPTEVIKHPAD